MREKLENLRNQAERRTELNALVDDLEKQMEKLDNQLFALKIDAHNQQADVDVLNMFSLKNLYYDLIGKKDELLSKETSESRAAKEKYNAAVFEIEQVTRQMESYKNELKALQGSEAEYWNLLQEALAVTQGTDREWVVYAMKDRLNTIISELETACAAGSAAYQMVDGLLQNIKNVRDWNMNLNGTAWSMTMQGYLNGTQKKIEDFRKQLTVFRKKLNDHPLPSQLFENADVIFIYPENYLRELTSKLIAEERLCEADAAVRAAERRLKNVLFQVEQITAQKRQGRDSLK